MDDTPNGVPLSDLLNMCGVVARYRGNVADALSGAFAVELARNEGSGRYRLNSYVLGTLVTQEMFDGLMDVVIDDGCDPGSPMLASLVAIAALRNVLYHVMECHPVS